MEYTSCTSSVSGKMVVRAVSCALMGTCSGQQRRAYASSPEKSGLKQYTLHTSQAEIWREAALFERVLYKNGNQHRRTSYFKRLLEVGSSFNYAKDTNSQFSYPEVSSCRYGAISVYWVRCRSNNTRSLQLCQCGKFSNTVCSLYLAFVPLITATGAGAVSESR